MIAFQKPPRDLEPEAALGWLLRLAHNQCMEIHRERRRWVPLPDDDGGLAAAEVRSDGGRFEDGALASELEAVLRRSIASLPIRLRQVAAMHLLQERSYAEIAARLEITAANARKRMQEARGPLRRRLCAYAAGDASLSVPSTVAAPAPALGARRRRPPWTVAALRAYVAKHPRGWKMRWRLARRLRAAGELDEAAAQLRLAAARKPGWIELQIDLGATLLESGRADEAIAVYREALAKASDHRSRRELRRRIDDCRP